MTLPPYNDDSNFCRVFRLPQEYPEGFLFGGGKVVGFQMVDWFNPIPSPGVFENHPETWEQLEPILIDFLKQKNYVSKGGKFLILTDFGKATVFGA